MPDFPPNAPSFHIPDRFGMAKRLGLLVAVSMVLVWMLLSLAI